MSAEVGADPHRKIEQGRQRVPLFMVSLVVAGATYFLRGLFVVGTMFQNNCGGYGRAAFSACAPPRQRFTVLIFVLSVVLALSVLLALTTLYWMAWRSRHRIGWTVILTVVILSTVTLSVDRSRNQQASQSAASQNCSRLLALNKDPERPVRC